MNVCIGWDAPHVLAPRLELGGCRGKRCVEGEENELIERLDAYAERLSEETGLEVKRADVVKRLLTKGLEAVEKPKKPKR
jgi:hypothetical protein